MKNVICRMIMLIVMAACLCSCAEEAEEVERVPVDCRYTEAWSGVETRTEYEYNICEGEFVLIPKIETVNHPERYELLWEITYSDGSALQSWEQCTAKEYENFRHTESPVGIEEIEP